MAIVLFYMAIRLRVEHGRQVVRQCALHRPFLHRIAGQPFVADLFDIE